MFGFGKLDFVRIDQRDVLGNGTAGAVVSNGHRVGLFVFDCADTGVVGSIDFVVPNEGVIGDCICRGGDSRTVF